MNEDDDDDSPLTALEISHAAKSIRTVNETTLRCSRVIQAVREIEKLVDSGDIVMAGYQLAHLDDDFAKRLLERADS